MNDLKPCPFCGGEAEIREWYITEQDVGYVGVSV